MIAGGVALVVGACTIMAVAWAIAERTGRSGWGDAIWSLGVGILGVAAALAPLDVAPPDVAPEASSRRCLVALVAAVWSLRLAVHIARRTLAGGEDPRYAELRRQWGEDSRRRLFWFFQIQALVAAVLASCVGLAARNPAPGLRLQDWLGLAVVVLAIAGESLADRQLRQFHTQSCDRRAVCDVGLWSLSRHPNYFFEWLAWCAYPLVAIDLQGHYAWGWLALLAPALMYGLLVHVSGIPPLEAHMLRSRGAAYRAYQARVNAFWPGLAALRSGRSSA